MDVQYLMLGKIGIVRARQATARRAVHSIPPGVYLFGVMRHVQVFLRSA
jgi:hypothetical protein